MIEVVKNVLTFEYRYASSLHILYQTCKMQKKLK